MNSDLPVLPASWIYKSLDSCVVNGAVSYGVVQPGAAQSDGVPIVRVNNFRDGQIVLSDLMKISPAIEAKYARTRLKGGEVLVTLVGSVGQVAIAPEGLSGFNVARAVSVIQPLPDIGPEWISLCLRSPFSQRRLNSRANTTVQTTINLKDLKALPIPIPPENERKRIVEMLFSIDNRIAVLGETNATLEAIARALFKSWFVDFEPVRAKAEGQRPHGIDSETAGLFPDGFEESELGLVPTGWSIKPIGEVVSCVGGGTPDTKNPEYWSPPEFSWTTPKDLSDLAAPILLATERKLSAEGLTRVSSGLLPAGTLLMSSRAPIGYLAIAQVPLAVNQGYIAMPPGSMLPPLYLLFWCQHNMESIKNRANGSTFMEISKRAFRPILTIVPTTEILDAFVEAVEPLFGRIAENSKQAQTLASIRDVLLPRLISGQVCLGNMRQSEEGFPQ